MQNQLHGKGQGSGSFYRWLCCELAVEYLATTLTLCLFIPPVGMMLRRKV